MTQHPLPPIAPVSSAEEPMQLDKAAHPGAGARRVRGFTLIEIMAVVVIMGMLMATLAVGINAQVENARRKNARVMIVRIEQALDFYKLDNRRYPTTDQGLIALVEQPSAPPVPKDYNPAGYIKREALEDPWGTPFEYRSPGDHNPYAVDIWSLGPDGVEGGDDIQNWDSGEGDG